VKKTESLKTVIEKNEVAREEIEWMIQQRPLIYSKDQLFIDYNKDATIILQEFNDASCNEFLGCLNWPGVGSRWRNFLNWLVLNKDGIKDTRDAFEKYANYLGRVLSYRALALTDEQYNKIITDNSIYPSGRLRTDAQTIRDTINTMGVWKVCYARLYIGLQLFKYDPSLSLHDDGETAVSIASGYMRLPEVRVHLMGLSVPKIEHCGFKLVDVQGEGNEHRWFQHNNVWFDANEERTERYTFYEIPFYKDRLMTLRIFNAKQEILDYIEPFKVAQLLKKNNCVC